jgi:murein DD-endopeptidase MepM/ murein hydrolase activator NlpD
LKRYRAHHGIDYATPSGTAIKAAYGGKVIFVGKKGGYGKTVVLRHPAGYRTLYAHLSRFKVHHGQRVKRGTLIAYSGNTGKSTGPHLHFGLSLNNRWIDPASRIVIKGGGLRGNKKRAFMDSMKLYKKKIEALLKVHKRGASDIPSLEELEEGSARLKDAA